jgi:glycosyltransferase involved in cell wall biosynthesis
MYGKKSSEAIVIPNGINTDRFAFSVEYRKKIREKIGVSENDIIIGHVGRFSAEKNQNFLVDLCMELKEKYKFICIGDGPLKQEIEAKVKKNNLTDRFIILPVSKNVNEYYSAMDFFALPSFNEGLPIVSVEAQCAGLTCLFSDKVSKETNISGYCEYLSLADIKQWKELIEKKDISRFDGVEAVKKAGFDMTNSANCIISLFDRVHRYNNA